MRKDKVGGWRQKQEEEDHQLMLYDNVSTAFQVSLHSTTHLFFFFKSLKCSKCRQYSRKKESIEIGGVKIVTLVVLAGDKSINIHEHRLPVP